MKTETTNPTREQILETLQNAPKGANINLAWHRPCKTYKKVKANVSKASRIVGRVGIDYNNQKIVKELRESGELPSEEQPIWKRKDGTGAGEWVAFPYLIRHKGTGQEYVRLYDGTGKAIPAVQFYKNDNPVEREEVDELMTSYEDASKTKPNCFTVKIEHVTEISWKSSEIEIDREPVREAAEEEETENVPA